MTGPFDWVTEILGGGGDDSTATEQGNDGSDSADTGNN